MSSSTPPPFKGWIAHQPTPQKGPLQWESFAPIPFTPTTIDIAISHCGICGSDLHTLSSGWGPTHYPACVGHEIIGHITQLGTAVPSHFRIGQRVGVGAQAGSCGKLDCHECSSGLENHCRKFVATYNSRLPGGEFTMGGYATHIRIQDPKFVFRIPEALKSEHAAPMMCAGITVYSALKRNGAGPGKRVGIVGVGGLGHFGILFAKAMGCKSVTAISRSSRKKADAEALGADKFIATLEEKKWGRAHGRSLDLIVCTVSEADMPLQGYLQLLSTGGVFVLVGAPEDKIPGFKAFELIQKGVSVKGSSVGSPAEIEEMLRVAADKGIVPWVEVRKMREANEAVREMHEGRARYRFVLENEGGGKAKL